MTAPMRRFVIVSRGTASSTRNNLAIHAEGCADVAKELRNRGHVSATFEAADRAGAVAAACAIVATWGGDEWLAPGFVNAAWFDVLPCVTKGPRP